ncbi:hypothetical protein EHW99_0629 [Erwinia amylovora]|uniref:Uncharacterized protein n=2 Tax=Erwinia amylovora TaxID=552 RepID=A0A831A453_ERWAM|nr:hypothetical protein EaACW_3000 [Erwinia amylovora ACW56400]QJQ53336.1 hypothetical protein EHX00_0629 [Erwinia amylovora]CBA22777.1 hypothetical protein predicted by Glimmer/Critica [Erwinia amylovora CFBP1430]CCO79842.1 hypothetical protein BN432_3063 [Erwinia amylovora Ea356]CCO83646.1 hypothetical protein BN433_3089 [Erwinia amylovora Ea266]CCO87404.1 hypothetical protein BN434_3034 [Erwinia amylovora CFBP 2585]CCO91202.1 hypothetical protein BN435_3050 [Erwinia amylovora 01SFR-BO]CCO
MRCALAVYFSGKKDLIYVIIYNEIGGNTDGKKQGKK